MDFNKDQIQESKSTVQQMAVSRQAQEVQTAMVVAKRFPRDEGQARSKILTSCQRIKLAEQATYEYPRGGTKVTGPSIRLAEALARGWGNIAYGIIELEQKDGVSEMMAYAWDLENNTRATRVFSVKHWRDTKSGGHKLTNTRDIYEMTANMGARRVRACILEVIPGDITDEAIEQCEVTIKSNSKQPLDKRIKEMIKVFKSEFEVTKKMLEDFIGCKSKAFSENDVLRLGKVYRSLKDGMAGIDDYFGNDEEQPESPFTQGDEDENIKKEIDKILEEDEDDTKS